jgi:hypothetical protein
MNAFQQKLVAYELKTRSQELLQTEAKRRQMKRLGNFRRATPSKKSRPIGHEENRL